MGVVPQEPLKKLSCYIWLWIVSKPLSRSDDEFLFQTVQRPRRPIKKKNLKNLKNLKESKKEQTEERPRKVFI